MANPLRDSSRHDEKAARGTAAPRRKWHISGLDPGQYSMARRPTFKHWLKTMIPDFFAFAAMGAVAWGVFKLPPAFNRSFPLTFQDGEVVYPQFAYPYQDQIVAAWVASFLGSVVPIVAILLCNIRIRSFWDINNGILGLLYGLVCATAFQVTVKTVVGGLRPNFYDVCKPDPNLAPNFNSTGMQRVGFAQLMFTREICTSENPDGVDNSLESFPSGHTTASFAGFVFLSLYLNAKFKLFADYHPAMWKLIIIYAPILLATLIGGSLTVDQSHNWYDVVAGAVIGTTFAVSSYRMVYASIWDWRTNHIPLNRNMPLDHGAGRHMEGFDYVVTRKAGWGVDHISGFGDSRRSHHTFSSGAHHSRGNSGSRHHHSSHRAHGSIGAAARGHEHRTHPEQMV